jgi:hypothetical protein
VNTALTTTDFDREVKHDMLLERARLIYRSGIFVTCVDSVEILLRSSVFNVISVHKCSHSNVK